MDDYFKEPQHSQDWIRYNQSIAPLHLPYSVLKSTLSLKFAPNITKLNRDTVVNHIKVHLSDSSILVDTGSLLHQIAQTNDAINILYIVIVVITMIIAFFIVWVSIMSNIREHLWEIGILRAEGLTKIQLAKVILIESMSIIVSSILLGIAIGAGITAITVIQMDQILERPFKLEITLLFSYIGV